MKRVITSANGGLSARERAKIAKTAVNPRELQRLAYDKSKVVREKVVQNKACPQSVLSYLADDEDAQVRETIARRTDNPQILAKLADDEKWEVYQVALHKIKKSSEPQKTNQRVKKPTQTDWSIPIYELQNYSDIESEIDAVISDAVSSAIAKVYPQEQFTFEVTADSYDEDGELLIDVANQTLAYDLQTLLPMATFSQKKKDCVKKLSDYLINNI